MPPTQGPFYSSTQAQVSASPDNPWSNLSNIGANDGSFATVGISTSSESSNLIKSSAYGFNLPLGATIRGIVVEINRKNSSAPALRVDQDVKLIKAGTVQSTNKADVATNYPTAAATATYGSATDLWGTTWTASDINNSGFGCAFDCTDASSGTSTVSVDFIRITVYYTPFSPFPSSFY